MYGVRLSNMVTCIQNGFNSHFSVILCLEQPSLLSQAMVFGGGCMYVQGGQKDNNYGTSLAPFVIIMYTS